MVDVIESRGQLRCEIRSEEDAWELLERVHSGEFDNRTVHPKFVGWPKLEIKFWVGSSQKILTAPMMEGLLSFQSSLNRAFLLIEEDTTNLKNLSEDDRKREEIRFKISSGSTKIDPRLIDVAKEFAKSAGEHMTGSDVTIVLVGAMLLWASQTAWRAWLDHKAKLAQGDTGSETIKQVLEAAKVATEADLRKMELMTKAIESAMGTRALIETGDEGKEGIARAASKVDNARIAGVELGPDVAKRIVRQSRSAPSRTTINSTFRVIRTDTEHADGFRVKLREEGSGEEFFAGLRDAIVNEEDKKIIMEAEWSHSTFVASVAICRHRGEVTSAEILSVSSGTNDNLDVERA